MDVIIGPLLNITMMILNLYALIIIVQVVLSWLIAFKIVNTNNRFVHIVGDFTYRLTEPALVPIRRFLPSISGIDFSPLVLLIVIFFLEGMLSRLALKMM